MKARFKNILVIIIFFIGYTIKDIFWLPMSIQAGMCALIYVYLGYNLKKCNIIKKLIDFKILIITIIVWGIGLYYDCGRLYLVSNYFGLKIFDFFISIIAVGINF